ncbi:kelch domain-containing protein 7A [Scleropages formosus]|uniref:Kelch domain containing 7A n=1 Tax=Scleropages formosus TaxID=113540 RepID=A0A8C9R2G7_SCLFO|nr:kelch domain-containing protein 7A-like [Scleropages formosus]
MQRNSDDKLCAEESQDLKMPIADLLGVQLDMQMLGKLTLSVATVLFVSWVYRFYSSRGRAAQTGPPSGSAGQASQPSNCATSPGLCRSRLAEVQPQSKAAPEGISENKLPGEHDSSPENTQGEVLLHKRPSTKNVIQTERLTEYLGLHAKLEMENNDVCQDSAVEELTLSKETNLEQQEQKALIEEAAEEGIDNCEIGFTLSSHATDCILLSPDCSQQSPTERPRSPCLLRKLEPSTEVSRELRQDLGFSSFQSKAAVIVEDGDLLLECPGDRLVEVRGKIYDYFVESSSESISASERIPSPRPYRVTHDSRDSQNLQLTQDLVFPSDSHEDFSPPTNRSPSPLSKPGLLRKDSYMHITENDDLQIPFWSPGTSTPANGTSWSRTSSSENAFSNQANCITESRLPSESAEPSLETVAGIKFLQMPLEGIGISELESLKGKLDLGNCMQALSLARKYRHATLEEASLKVMSDNYLQVLRDPELYGKLRAGDRAHIQKLRMRGKQYLLVADIDPQDWARTRSQTSNSDSSQTSSRLYYYNDYKDTWHTLSKLPREVVSKGCAMCTMDNYLFVAIGCEGSDRDIKPSRRVFCYNPMTSIWKEICPMNEARPQCKLVALQGYIYAIGGECLSTVERYDPRVDQWAFVAPLPNDTFAVAHRATACQGELFVLGGTLRYVLLRYSPLTNTWRQSLIVGSKERTTDMVSVRNFLYRFDISPSLGLSVYRYHTVARLWYECCSRRLPDCLAFQCTTLDNIIYCINRQFNMRFLADDVSPQFVAEDLNILSVAKGMLFPFVLALPDKDTLQTRV